MAFDGYIKAKMVDGGHPKAVYFGLV
jgi:hypothetical protein